MDEPLTDDTRAALVAELPRMLAAAPHDAHVLALIDSVLGAAADPLALAPLEPVSTIETAALHARALFAAGRSADALCLLADIAALDPEFPALGWLEACPPKHMAALDLSTEARFVTALTPLADDPRLGVVLAQLSSPEARTLHAEVLRRAGDVDRALAVSSKLALPAAERTFARATADRLFDEGRFAEAAALYREADDGNPADTAPDALASRLVCEILLEPLPDADLQPLRALARSGNRRALTLLQRLDPPPFLGLLPLPFDEATQKLRLLLPSLPADEPWAIRWEGVAPAPSSELALAIAASRVGTTVTFDHTACLAREALPRRPEGTSALYDQLVYLAGLPGDADDLFHAAREIAQATRFDEAPGWLSVNAHLPLPPDETVSFDVFAWVQRCQLAAMSVVAQLDEGWQGSLRRLLILDLLRGPSDWLVGFAAIAAARITRHDRTDRDELAACIRAAQDRAPEACWSQFALASAGLYAGGGDDDDRRRWWRTQSLWLRFGARQPAVAAPVPTHTHGPPVGQVTL